MEGVVFGGRHSEDYGAIMNYARITPPSVKENYVDIAGGDSDIDLTEAVGGVVFEDGQIDFKFTLFDRMKKEQMKNDLHGKRMDIMLGRDPEFHYEGRVKCTKDDQNGTLFELYFEVKVKPYKIQKRETVHIEEINNGTKEIFLINSRMPVMPAITVDGDISLFYEGTKYRMKTGTYQIPEITLYEGRSLVKLSGKGVVKFVYKKGQLI